MVPTMQYTNVRKSNLQVNCGDEHGKRQDVSYEIGQQSEIQQTLCETFIVGGVYKKENLVIHDLALTCEDRDLYWTLNPIHVSRFRAVSKGGTDVVASKLKTRGNHKHFVDLATGGIFIWCL
jgi:hypothetical protein